MRKCIEKMKFLRGWGLGGSVGLGGGSFSAYAEMRKEIHEVLDFQRFSSFRNSFCKLSAFFPQCVKALTFNALLTSSKCLFLNVFTHLNVLGKWVKGRVWGRVGFV